MKSSPAKGEEIVKAIREMWSSIDSHLDYAVSPVKPKSYRKLHGGMRFHKQCVRDYAEVLLLLSKIL